MTTVAELFVGVGKRRYRPIGASETSPVYTLMQVDVRDVERGMPPSIWATLDHSFVVRFAGPYGRPFVTGHAIHVELEALDRGWEVVE